MKQKAMSRIHCRLSLRGCDLNAPDLASGVQRLLRYFDTGKSE